MERVFALRGVLVPELVCAEEGSAQLLHRLAQRFPALCGECFGVCRRFPTSLLACQANQPGLQPLCCWKAAGGQLFSLLQSRSSGAGKACSMPALRTTCSAITVDTISARQGPPGRKLVSQLFLGRPER